uniref:Voltage-gated hydrogen channel 1 n=1 Tax=Phallusia mammillata TaxID=59560 RepID=A0A6F9DF53_9ASCI|nr:voltage-gated hydrogen channel 1 [Phallusia mammillata]
MDESVDKHDSGESTPSKKSKRNQIFNPNYASVRCTQPLPSVIKLRSTRRLAENNSDEIEDVSNDHEPKQSSNDQPLLLTNHAYEQHCLNKNNNKNESLKNPSGKPNSDSQTQLTEAGKPNQGKVKSLGMFQYMKFERQKGEDGEVVVVEPSHIPVPEDHEELTTRQKLMHILHSKPVHIIIIVLVIIDCFLVIFELLVDVKAITFPPENPIPGIFHGFSIAILSVFMIEIGLKIYADHRHFIRHKIEVLDAVVVIISFAVDIALVFFENSEALAALGLLVILRLWRVFRIVNGIIVTVKTKADERVHTMKEKVAAIEKSLDDATSKNEKQANEIKVLRQLLQDNNVEINEDLFSHYSDETLTDKDPTIHLNVESATTV